MNLFHERVEPSNPDRRAVAYVRPHELGITRNPGMPARDVPATIRFIASSGRTVRLELERTDNGHVLEGEIPRERFRELSLAVGDVVGVSPNNLRAFPETTGTHGDGISRLVACRRRTLVAYASWVNIRLAKNLWSLARELGYERLAGPDLRTIAE